MKPEKEDSQVQPSAHKDIQKLDAQQLESVQGGVLSPVRVLDEASTSRDSSGPSWITPDKTSITSVNSGTTDSTTSGSAEVTSALRNWVQGAIPGKRRRIG